MSGQLPASYHEMLRAFAAAEASLPKPASHGHFEVALKLCRSMLSNPALSEWHTTIKTVIETRLHFVEERLRLANNSPPTAHASMQVLIAAVHLFNDPELGIGPGRINATGLDELLALVRKPYEALTPAEQTFLTSQFQRLGLGLHAK
jgi:hypothetical protein